MVGVSGPTGTGSDRRSQSGPRSRKFGDRDTDPVPGSMRGLDQPEPCTPLPPASASSSPKLHHPHSPPPLPASSLFAASAPSPATPTRTAPSSPPSMPAPSSSTSSSSIFDPRSESSELAHESLALLAMLQLIEPECIAVASDPDRVAYFTRLLFHPRIGVRINTAALIEAAVTGIRSLELHPQSEDLHQIPPTPTVSSSSSTLARRSALGLRGCRRPAAGLRGGKAEARVAFVLCLVKPMRHRAVIAGAGAALVDRLGDLV